MTPTPVPLGEVAEINPRSSACDVLQPEDVVSFVPMAAVSEMTAAIETVEERPFAEVSKGYTKFQKGDVIVAKITPCFENGKLALADRLPTEAATGSTEFHVVRPREKADSAYLFHLLRGPYVRAAGAMKMRGAAGQRRVPASFLEDLQIPLPPIPEQKRIAAILDAADALRVKRRESLKHLDALVQSVFLEMFGDPVANPKGWETAPLGDVSESRLGKMLDKGREVGDSQFPYLANTNVQWRRFELEDLRTMDFSEADRVEFELRDGDLLVCEGGEVGRCAIWRGEMEDVYFQKALHRVRLDPRVAMPEYAYFYMWFLAQHGGFARVTNSSTIAHLTGVKLKKLPFPKPPLPLQRDFAEIDASIRAQKARLEAHLAELDTLFASLQSRAFRGEL